MIARAYYWELRKLLAQRRTYLGLGAVAAAAVAFVVAIVVDPPGDGGSFFLRYTEQTGFAVPLVLLLFSAAWFLPLVIALVAGDIVAAEDGNRTLKTILTRSTSRSALFAAKAGAALTYTVAALLLLALTGTLAGGAASGFDPLQTFTRVVTPAEATALIALSFAVYAMPMLALACVGVLLSTVARNSAGAVVGTLLFALLLQFTQIVPGLDAAGVQRWLLSQQFDAWQTLFHDPVDWSPVAHAALVSALYGGWALALAWVHFLRRDVHA